MEYMDLLPPTAPSLVFAHETCTPYWLKLTSVAQWGIPLTDSDILGFPVVPDMCVERNPEECDVGGKDIKLYFGDTKSTLSKIKSSPLDIRLV